VAQGAHKQVVNRILEPFQWISVIVTATEWDNFFELRDHEDADPNIAALARAMNKAMVESDPVQRLSCDRGTADGWHLPYVTEAERQTHYHLPHYLAKLSVARCARVSYLNHDGSAPDADKDLELYARLVGGRPLHASPVEHQGYALAGPAIHSRNFRGWQQFREIVEASIA
jgi:thymidylate synthase ThyX